MVYSKTVILFFHFFCCLGCASVFGGTSTDGAKLYAGKTTATMQRGF